MTKKLRDATARLVVQVDGAKWPAPYNAALVDALAGANLAVREFDEAPTADKINANLLAAAKALLDVQSRRRHPLGAPDEGIAYDAAAAASMARDAIAAAEG